MLRLKLNPDPAWHDLARGVRVLCCPVTSSQMEAVREDLFGKTGDAEAEAEETEAEETRVITFVDWCKALAPRVVLDWEGVADESGDPVPPDAEWLSAMLDDDLCYTAFRDRVLMPALLADAEGNGSSGAPSGTSAAPATATAA
ncbi:hypothetical protein [Sagittula stellata]|uniref:Uncharacterized protein n=1 Tax=Sagittula stellata (strain ATCC 700073 / DSM 11524 / E-37) TaxID=388399 RepID=A3K203_SAGS3|nr:hypothetical protein [Sagittula stellata]EBA08949.1 hypothetical protein SSE37_04865 [Sagittula stellata E-37]